MCILPSSRTRGESPGLLKGKKKKNRVRAAHHMHAALFPPGSLSLSLSLSVCVSFSKGQTYTKRGIFQHCPHQSRLSTNSDESVYGIEEISTPIDGATKSERGGNYSRSKNTRSKKYATATKMTSYLRSFIESKFFYIHWNIDCPLTDCVVGLLFFTIFSFFNSFIGVTDLPSELQRAFQGLRDLDVRVTKLQEQVDADCMAQLNLANEQSGAKRQRVGTAVDVRKLDPELADKIESNMNEIIRLSEEKMSRAQQIYDTIDQHIRKLDKGMKSFETEVAKDRQRLGLPPLNAAPLQDAGGGPLVPVPDGRDGRRKRGGKGGASKKSLQQMALFGGHGGNGGNGKTSQELGGQPATSEELYQAALAVADPTEPTYCYCKRISFGEMIACEHPECPIEWFHFECVGLTPENRPKGKWYCEECRQLLEK